jgi:hypothetical protein
MSFSQAIQRYNFHAAGFGWLPINLTPDSSPEIISAAANRCLKLYPEISVALLMNPEQKRIAALQRTSKAYSAWRHYRYSDNGELTDEYLAASKELALYESNSIR